MLKKILSSLIIGVFLASGAPAFADDNATLAVVNREPIFVADFNRRLLPLLDQIRANVPAEQQATPEFDEYINELRNSILNQQIDEILLRQEARRQRIRIPRREIDEAVNSLRQRFPSDADFREELRREGMTVAQVEREFENQTMVVRLVEREVRARTNPPTEAQTREFFNQIRTKMRGGLTGLSPAEDAAIGQAAEFLRRAQAEQIRLRKIFVRFDGTRNNRAERDAAQARVSTIQRALEGDLTFAEVARQHSEDQITRPRGGDLGTIVRGDLNPTLEAAAFALRLGEHTRTPIQLPDGFYFLRVEGKTAAKEFTFEEIQNDLAEMLFQLNLRRSYEALISSLRDRATITINRVW